MRLQTNRITGTDGRGGLTAPFFAMHLGGSQTRVHLNGLAKHPEFSEYGRQAYRELVSFARQELDSPGRRNRGHDPRFAAFAYFCIAANTAKKFGMAEEKEAAAREAINLGLHLPDVKSLKGLAMHLGVGDYLRSHATEVAYKVGFNNAYYADLIMARAGIIEWEEVAPVHMRMSVN